MTDEPDWATRELEPTRSPTSWQVQEAAHHAAGALAGNDEDASGGAAGIAIANHERGVGKTTTALVLAHAADARNLVLVIGHDVRGE